MPPWRSSRLGGSGALLRTTSETGGVTADMRTYILKRLLLIVPTLLGAAVLVFLIMRVIPGDVALLILGGDQGQIDQKQLVALRSQLGLDQPLLVQFGRWLWGV